MTYEEKVFLIVLVVNLIIVLLYLLLSYLLKIVWKKERFRSILPKAAVMLLCPVVGPCFMFFGYLCHRLLFYRSVDLEDVIFSKERIKPQMPAEEESESNLVPVEEAISITDRDNLRSMMLHVVRGDIKASASAISMALNSDDSEASHYAASALQGVLNEFAATTQNNYAQIMAQPEEESGEERAVRLSLAADTLDSMAQFMKHRLLSDSEQARYARMMDEIGEKLLEEDASRMTAERLEAICMQQLEAKNYEMCRKWCMQIYTRFPDAPEGYTSQLKLYFTTGEKDKLFRILHELRSSDISIDRETLEMVRVFL